MRGWLALLLLFPADGQTSVRLPELASEVRFQQGRILALTPAPSGARTDRQIVVIDREGRVERRVTPSPQGLGYRRILVRDAGLRPGLGIIAFLTLEQRLGQTARGLVEIPLQGEQTYRDLEDRVCERVLGGDDHIWCLGFDLGRFVRKQTFDVLYYLGPAGEIVPALPLQRLGLRRLPDATYLGPWSNSDIGPPQLFSGGGAAFAWMPNVNTLARMDLPAGTVDLQTVPVRRAGRSLVTLAATESGRVFGLFPLRGPEEQQEALSTVYGFYELERESSKWLLRPALGEAPRGTQLVGSEGENLVLWMRSQRRVEWRPAPPR